MREASSGRQGTAPSFLSAALPHPRVSGILEAVIPWKSVTPAYEPMTNSPDPPHPNLLMTQELLQRAQSGDHEALDALMTRYRPRLERWASGRLPEYARSLLDTSDLVQDTLMRALKGLDGFEDRGPGMFQAYVRKSILNGIRDQVRRARTRAATDLTDEIEDKGPSPLEAAIGTDLMERYERALAELSETEQRLLHLRIELDFSYPEIAVIMGRTPDSARMAAQRALLKLAEIIDRGP